MADAIVKRLEDVATRLETLANLKPALPPKPLNASGSNIVVSSSDTPSTIKQYDDEVGDALNAFTSISKNIGGDVGVMSDKVNVVFELLRNYIWYAAGRKQGSQEEVGQKMKPIMKLVEEIGELKESKRNTPAFNHLCAVADGIPAVGWVTVTPTPAPYVKEMIDVSMFYVNRVKTEYKNKEPIHTEWTKAWVDLLTSVQKYVKAHHTTGLTWNSAPGKSPPETKGGALPPSSGGPPPPPPPPPAGFFDENKPKAGPSGGNDARQALFAEINKGEAITSGLKKVTDDQKTHKNPAIRGNTAIPAKIATPGSKPGAAAKPAVEKPPRTELREGKFWEVEYHKNNKQIVIEVNDMKQVVYIFRCEGSVVQIKGKCNSVTIDNCKKTSVVFDNLLAQVEIINSQSVEVQSMGTLPTISIQKTDGCQVYLSKESVGAEVVTSKSSEMNILVPDGDDFVELPVPEQFKTTFNPATKKLVTVVSDIV
ncbi:unnamed protein product [Bursaphelenchus okinawaensis]|uniref:Adenylyl cyclase-associated protein n=1 Tax=Bursaphelenchus okinawaensis TaxID=465554 RepID=A0A811LMC5_9BILA|nr:unnamed protein product [Bursaphelenchus okinawaensis]CAG9126642.1 unnamed protein product [Bursaphelenchus okinawaensis]